MSTMTREQAVQAGWEFSLLFRGEYTFASKGTKDETTIFRNSESEVLESITSIERYADAERLLEEIELECMHAIESGRDSKAMKAVEEIRAMLEARK